MTKKTDFLPALKSTGNFHELTSVHAIGTTFVDNRDLAKLCAPDKAHEKNGPQWKLQTTYGEQF